MPSCATPRRVGIHDLLRATPRRAAGTARRRHIRRAAARRSRVRRAFLAKNLCGICTRIPAPSPARGSAPTAPRCSRLSRMVSASSTILCDLRPLMSAMKPTPQEAFSSAGSNSPPCSQPCSPNPCALIVVSRALPAAVLPASRCFTHVVARSGVASLRSWPTHSRRVRPSSILDKSGSRTLDPRARSFINTDGPDVFQHPVLEAIIDDPLHRRIHVGPGHVEALGRFRARKVCAPNAPPAYQSRHAGHLFRWPQGTFSPADPTVRALDPAHRINQGQRKFEQRRQDPEAGPLRHDRQSDKLAHNRCTHPTTLSRRRGHLNGLGQCWGNFSPTRKRSP